MSQATGTATPSLMSLFAGGSRAIDLLPHLHRHALETTGGGCSLLFEYNPRSAALHPTSGYGLDELRVDPWMPVPEENKVLTEAFGRAEPVLVTDLAEQMEEPGVRLGLLAIGFSTAPDITGIGLESRATADAFVTAIDLLRLRRRDDLLR